MITLNEGFTWIDQEHGETKKKNKYLSQPACMYEDIMKLKMRRSENV